MATAGKIFFNGVVLSLFHCTATAGNKEQLATEIHGQVLMTTNYGHRTRLRMQRKYSGSSTAVRSAAAAFGNVQYHRTKTKLEQHKDKIVFD